MANRIDEKHTRDKPCIEGFRQPVWDARGRGLVVPAATGTLAGDCVFLRGGHALMPLSGAP